MLGFAVLLSARLGYPLVKALLYNPKVLNTERIARILGARGHSEAFEARLWNATYLLSATFFFSALMNYLLASWIVTSAAFNAELGRLTLINYAAIAIPSIAMMLCIFYFLWRGIHRMTGLQLEEILTPSLANKG